MGFFKSFMTNPNQNTEKNQSKDEDLEKSKLLDEFLKLIKERYAMADEANFFLEQSGVSSINIAVTNQRDFISHFVSFLNTENIEEKKAQINFAEEHLRRAIIEPYQIKLDLLKESIADNYILIKKQYGLTDTENDPIVSDIKDIEVLYDKGRRSKSQNYWNDELKEGIKSFVLGFEKASLLNEKLEKIIYEKRLAEENKKQLNFTNLQKTIFFLLGVFATYLISFLL